MPRRGHAASPGASHHALAGLTLLSACTVAGAWLSFVWPRPEAHAALPEAERARSSSPPTAAPAQLHVVLATFETRTSPAELRASQLAAARLHGLLLAPGDTFDFNARVGAYDPGALDQLASTLHAAAFFAGLPIVERAPQTSPNFYIRLGLEAAVQPGRHNLRFRNDRRFALQIALELDAGSVRAQLRGAARELRVTWIRDLLPTAAVPERAELDPSLPRGMRVLSQRGTPGFSVRTQRAIVDEAQQRSVYEVSAHDYPATPQLWRIGMAGTLAPGFVRPRNDPRPEYVADAHLEMTQQEPGTFAVRRDAGRTGGYGWTAREGFLVRRE